MSTDIPEKVMLKILRNYIPLTHSMAANTQYLLEELSDIISILDRFRNCRKVLNFLFVFENSTKCSDASHSDFSGVNFISDNMAFPEISLKKTCGMIFLLSE